jgi:hypothetical protein
MYFVLYFHCFTLSHKIIINDCFTPLKINLHGLTLTPSVSPKPFTHTTLVYNLQIMRGRREHAFHHGEVKAPIQLTFSVEHSLFNRGKTVRTLMIWRVHIICFNIRCIHDHSWYKIPSAKNNKFKQNNRK